MTKRLTSTDLPLKATVQVGEIFGSDIEWYETMETTLAWKDKVNLDDEPGIDLDHGGWGYAGYENGIYLRYDAPLEENEHCFRIVE